MYGALPEPRISWRLLFSITMVNTVPAHRGCAVAAVGSTRHTASVLPEVLGGVQLAPASTPPSEPMIAIHRCDFILPENLVSDGVSGKHKMRAHRRRSVARASLTPNREKRRLNHGCRNCAVRAIARRPTPARARRARPGPGGSPPAGAAR